MIRLILSLILGLWVTLLIITGINALINLIGIEISDLTAPLAIMLVIGLTAYLMVVRRLSQPQTDLPRLAAALLLAILPAFVLAAALGLLFSILGFYSSLGPADGRESASSALFAFAIYCWLVKKFMAANWFRKKRTTL